MDLFSRPSKDIIDKQSQAIQDGVEGSTAISVDNNGNEIDMGDIGEAKGYKCCGCGKKGKEDDFPPAENEKPICHECLVKRRERGNKLPDEFVNKVINIDCFDLIKDLPLESIDLCLVDPPFGTSGETESYGRLGKKILNDEDESINYRFLEAIYPKMKRDSSLYLFCSWKFCDKIKDFALGKGYDFEMLACYVKNNIGLGNGNFRPQHEMCLVLNIGDPIFFRRDISNVWFAKHINHTQSTHPHQKDYDTLRRIILHSSREGDVVFDSFMGSGSTAIASLREGRKFIGCELDAYWYKLIQRNLQIEQSKISMF